MPSCPICNKVYIRDAAYQRHLTMCKFIPQTAAAKNETENMPTYAEMWSLLQQFTIKCAAMEQKILVLETIVNTKKKKVGVFEWLNTNIIPPMNYLDWVKTIKVKPSQLLYLFDNNIVDTVVIIINTAITATPVVPMYAFGKTQTFYVLGATNSWVLADVLVFTQLFKHVEMELWKLLNKWKMENSVQIYEIDAVSNKYQKTISKLTDISYTPNDTYNKMKTKIYNSIKMGIKSIIEEEIEF